MKSNVDKLIAQALTLTPIEREALIRRLAISLDGDPEDTPEAIAKAWDDEIARRVAEIDVGHTQWIPANVVMNNAREIIAKGRKDSC